MLLLGTLKPDGHGMNTIPPSLLKSHIKTDYGTVLLTIQGEIPLQRRCQSELPLVLKPSPMVSASFRPAETHGGMAWTSLNDQHNSPSIHPPTLYSQFLARYFRGASLYKNPATATPDCDLSIDWLRLHLNKCLWAKASTVFIRR